MAAGGLYAGVACLMGPLTITLAEPATTLTDYAITVEMLLFAVLLLQFSWVERFWAAAFACVGVAAALGGTYHGFAEHLTYAQQVELWQGTVVALAWASFWPIVAVSWPCRRFWKFSTMILAVSKLILSLALIRADLGFAFRVLDYLSTLIIVIWVYGWQSRQHQLPGLPWIVSGLVISFIAAGVLAVPGLPLGKLSPAAAYHLVQMVALYCLYQGVRCNALARVS